MHLSTPVQRLAALPVADRSSTVPIRSAGCPAHPTNDHGGDGEPAGRLSFVALRAIVAGLARVQRSVPLADEDPGTARSVRLLATTFYDVWLITWPDGSGLAPHDHRGAKSVLQVIDGELIETVTDHADEHTPTSRVLRRGDVTKTTRSSVHEIANRSGDDATTIHAYSPPLADVAFFSLRDPGAVQWLRTIPVAERVPEASSRDLPLPRPGRRSAALHPIETR